jgi:hypothetical protein
MTPDLAELRRVAEAALPPDEDWRGAVIAFRETFTPTLCLELLGEVERLKANGDLLAETLLDRGRIAGELEAERDRLAALLRRVLAIADGSEPCVGVKCAGTLQEARAILATPPGGPQS